MNIFTGTYHAIKNIIMYPMKLINGNTNIEKLEQQELIRKQKQIEKESKMKIEQPVQRPAPTISNDRTDVLEEEIRSNSASISRNNVNQLPKSDVHKKRTAFDYVVKNDIGQITKSSFDAQSIDEVRAFLINEGYEIVSISAKRPLSSIDISLFKTGKLKTGELSFALTQLATYIKAGIPLIDSIRILAKQSTNPNKRKIYERIVYDLVTGENFSNALENQDNVFPRLLINMVKTSEMTGDLPTTLEEMSDYYTSIEKTKKAMISALAYPAVVFTMSVAVVIFCLVYVVPNFTKMYADQEAALPAITQFTVGISGFLGNNWMYILGILVFLLVVYKNLFKNIKSFRRTVQTFYMKLPVFGKIIIYNEVTMFTKTFASLLNHSVHITDSMEILSKISNNEIFKEIIMNTLNTLSKGGKISESFRGQWAFPIVAYEMLVTGESTGQLGIMMEKVSDHYNELHKNSISAVKSLIEPLTIVFLAVAVGFILLSVILPMFSIYGEIG